MPWCPAAKQTIEESSRTAEKTTEVQKVLQARYFSFRSAALKGMSGQARRLDRAEADFGGSRRRPLRLRFISRDKNGGIGPVLTTVELSRSEAYAFAEWLDEATTQVPDLGQIK